MPQDPPSCGAERSVNPSLISSGSAPVVVSRPSMWLFADVSLLRDQGLSSRKRMPAGLCLHPLKYHRICYIQPFRYSTIVSLLNLPCMVWCVRNCHRYLVERGQRPTCCSSRPTVSVLLVHLDPFLLPCCVLGPGHEKAAQQWGLHSVLVLNCLGRAGLNLDHDIRTTCKL